MLSAEDRPDALLLQRAQFPPPKRIYDVVLNEGIELFKGRHRSREMSSIDEAGMAFRSSMVSSSLRMVRR